MCDGEAFDANGGVSNRLGRVDEKTEREEDRDAFRFGGNNIFAWINIRNNYVRAM